MTIRPGDLVKDKISGAEGIVVCRSEWQYGCVRLTVQPKAHKEGKPADTFVVDEPQAEVLKAQDVPDTREPERPRNYGDRADAARGQEAIRR